MLEYHKNGKKEEVRAIYSKGEVGQIVILDGVSFGENPDTEKNPLSRYPLRTIFTIVKKDFKDAWNYSYELKDAKGGHFVLIGGESGSCTCYLYDLAEWIKFQEESEKEHRARKDAKITLLESQVALLKDILIKQGVRIVTKQHVIEGYVPHLA